MKPHYVMKIHCFNHFNTTEPQDYTVYSHIKALKQDNNKVLLYSTGFPSDSAVKNPPANAGDLGLIPGSGRSPGEGNGNPLHIFASGIP